MLQQVIEQVGFPADRVQQLCHQMRLIGLTQEQIDQGLRHPMFIKSCMAVLSPAFYKLPVTVKLASLCRIVEQISKMTPMDILDSAATSTESKTRRKRRNELNLNTLRRVSVLAVLYDREEGASIDELAQHSLLKVRALRTVLPEMLQSRWIKKGKVGKHDQYLLTHRGIKHLFDATVQVLPCDYQIYGRTHCQTCTVGTAGDRLVDMLRHATSVVRELLSLGWYYRSVREALRRHDPRYILRMITIAKNKPFIENIGGYLYAILVKKVPAEVRKVAMQKAILSHIPETLQGVYLDEAKSMTPQQSCFFANLLRKQYEKATAAGEEFFPGQVWQAANFVRKCNRGTVGAA